MGRRQGRLGKIFKQFGWGAGKSAAFIGAASLVGGGAWVGIVAGLAAAVVVAMVAAGAEMAVAVRTEDKGGEGAGQSERHIKDHWAGWTVARVRNSLVKARTCEPRPPRNSGLSSPRGGRIA